ncbi:MAG: fumarylacetoacetate hydrolase family protein, partial [Janthinobacterium lividum]
MTGVTPPRTPVALALVRLDAGDQIRWAVRSDGVDRALGISLDELLRLPRAEARAVVEAAGGADPVQGDLLAPVDTQEVWAAGVTYERSRDGRVAESTEADVYTRVYSARRPELFFKASGPRVVGDGQSVGVRVDSAWNAPEAELGLVLDAAGEVFGYVAGNDVSSRSIEGENPLYLPQAKVYARSCALGPGIVPVWAAPEPPFRIDLRVDRAGATAFTGSTSTASLARPTEDLVSWLTAALDFSVGAVLL